MAKRFGKVLVSLLGLGLLVAGVAVTGILFAAAIRAGSTFWTAAIAAIATVGAAFVLRAFERRKVMEEVRREQLTDAYVEMAQVLHGRSISEESRNEVMLEFMRKSLVYASANTVKAFNEWSEQMPDGDQEDLKLWKASSLRYEAFVKAMRSDLGISNWNLQDGDLIRIGIDDFDDW
jgi:hypothetical protein